jgi:exodeoxyribonuclease VII small subunit
MTNEEFRYGDAIKEIEEILEHIENEDLDVDDLTGKVKRVAQLIKLCRNKLTQTEQAVEKILEEMQDK